MEVMATRRYMIPEEGLFCHSAASKALETGNKRL
jgi:hypothetical protein